MPFRSTAAALTLVLAPAIMSGQDTGGASHDGMASASQAAFRIGSLQGLTIGVPHLDLNGGFFYAPEKDGNPELQTGFVSARMQAGLGTEHVQLAANALFVPKLGGAPQFTTVLQFVPTKQQNVLHFSVGAGMVNGRFDGSTRADAWVEAVLALRTPVHVISPFVQIGQPLRDGARAQILIGAAHPLMPYTFHLTH